MRLTENMTSNRLSENLFRVGEMELVAYKDGEVVPVKEYKALVNLDSGAPITVVSKKYTVVQHADLLHQAEEALDSLGYNNAPRRCYLRGQGRRMDAIFRLDRHAMLLGDDRLTPVIRVGNSYDRTNRATINLGLFRNICMNLSLSGGGHVKGFSTIHSGAIDVPRAGEEITKALQEFPKLLDIFNGWAALPFEAELRRRIEESFTKKQVGKKHFTCLLPRRGGSRSVWEAYNDATHYATHRCNKASVALGLLEKIDGTFHEVVR